MELRDTVDGIAAFGGWNHTAKAKFFCWFLHKHRNKERVTAADVNGCFDELSLERPANIYRILGSLAERKPKQALKNAQGFCLVKGVTDEFDASYGQHRTTIQVRKLLRELPARVPTVNEREFVSEAVICVEHGANRAAIVMTWNVSFDHLCAYVFAHHLESFNARWPIRFPKEHARSKIQLIDKRQDFSEIRESDVLEVCRSAGIITADVYKILDQKLDVRNSAAHPSTIVFTTLQVEEYVSNLVNNVVLLLKI